MEKIELRKKIKSILLNLSSDEKKQKDRNIYNKLIKMQELIKAETIFSYVSMHEEVDTINIIKYILKEKKKLFVPRVALKTKQMDIIQISSLENLKIGTYATYNILEPGGRDSCRKDFDILLIPGLGFDNENNRLGRGGGYFDKFLKNVKGLKIALCYREQIFESIPVVQHDIKVDLIISD